MRKYGKSFRQSAPFVRLLVGLVIGILVQHYVALRPVIFLVAIVTGALVLIGLRIFPVNTRFRFRWINGIGIGLMMMGAGASLVFCRDIRNYSSWIGEDNLSSAIQITLLEPLTEKPRSYKSLAKIDAVWKDGRWDGANGFVLVYFRKDSTAPNVDYGSSLVIRNKLQPIASLGNPGAFDYRQFCAARNIYHQVYLQRNDYYSIDKIHRSSFSSQLFRIHHEVLQVLRKWIPGEKEIGVAEALLIGYRNDLDKDLVQAYSNTGVVHIIAISGLHLGMIYGLLMAMFKPLRRFRWTKIAKPLTILAVLWLFTLLTGAAASILRSAVMFSFIVIGESINRRTRTQIYNTLAASAFCMLVYDPGMLWDVGFQLSYAAVLSIVIFMKPIYRQVYFTNKLLSIIWELNCITLAAQLLTLPLILFYFHQFPNLFLFTNFIVVPLSGFILYGELVLLLVSKLPILSGIIGKITSAMITQMNGLIERTSRVPFSTTDNIPFNLWQALLLYGILALVAGWIFLKKPRMLLWALTCCCAFIGVWAIDQYQQRRQQLLIVYNIPKYAALDIVAGKECRFYGDKNVVQDPSLFNFHLRPARLLHGVREKTGSSVSMSKFLVRTHRISVLVVGPGFRGKFPARKPRVDVVVLSHRPFCSVPELANMIDCRQYVFDSSNPLWKIRQWKKQADSLHLRHHSIPEQGAFQLSL